MKWMGWGWDDFCAAPPIYIERVIALINQEAEEVERVMARNRG